MIKEKRTSTEKNTLTEKTDVEKWKELSIFG
jgi:hypothetical protein